MSATGNEDRRELRLAFAFLAEAEHLARASPAHVSIGAEGAADYLARCRQYLRRVMGESNLPTAPERPTGTPADPGEDSPRYFSGGSST